MSGWGMGGVPFRLGHVDNAIKEQIIPFARPIAALAYQVATEQRESRRYEKIVTEWEGFASFANSALTPVSLLDYVKRRSVHNKAYWMEVSRELLPALEEPIKEIAQAQGSEFEQQMPVYREFIGEVIVFLSGLTNRL